MLTTPRWRAGSAPPIAPRKAVWRNIRMAPLPSISMTRLRSCGHTQKRNIAFDSRSEKKASIKSISPRPKRPSPSTAALSKSSGRWLRPSSTGANPMFAYHHQKIISDLFTLSQAKDLREGDFSLTLTQQNRPVVTISLSIHSPAPTALPDTASQVLDAPAQPAQSLPLPIRTFYTSAYFLEQ